MNTLSVLGFVALFALMLLRVPIGIAMGVVGVVGFGMIRGPEAAISLLALTPIRTATEAGFTVIPLFLLMGAIATLSGMSSELFRAANSFLGHRKGGLGMATIVACAGFASICGSSVATAATFSQVAYPEMRRFNYPKSFSTGVIAVGGTLGAILPPAIMLAVYSLLTQRDLGQLYMAGVIPGLLAVVMYVITIWLIGVVRPGFLPKGPRTSWPERLRALRGVWPIALLFVLVIGGIYAGVFTPVEAGAMGAAGALIIAMARRRLSRPQFLEALLIAVRTAAAIFTILIGALLFGYFLTITQTPQKVAEFITGLGLGRYHVIMIIALLYILLGAVMDEMAMVILTVPILLPVITALGFDPIWFGIVVVITVQLGMVAPPVGMNVFVIKGVLKDVPMSTIYAGVLPFLVTDIIRLALVIAFPALALWLPSQM